MTAAVWQQDDHSYASWTTETFVDLDNLLIYMNFSVPLSDQDTGYGNDTVQTMVDLCKLLEHGDNFLVELLLDEIETKADIKLSCPFVKVSDREEIGNPLSHLYLNSKSTTCSTLR